MSASGDGGGAIRQQRRRRGPLLPRSDPANRTPEDDENDNDDGGCGGGSRPPPHGKTSRHLPVQSSGYGRPSPARSARSGRRSSLGGRRHGDGSLPGSVDFRAGGKRGAARLGLSKPSEATKASKTTDEAKAPAPGGGPKKSGGGARRASTPADLKIDAGRRREARSRTPSPAAAAPRRPGRRLGGGGGSAGEEAPAGRRATFGGGSDSQDEPKDYGAMDLSDEPTPVKEARRLSSLFRDRASAAPSGVDDAVGGGGPPSPPLAARLFRPIEIEPERPDFAPSRGDAVADADPSSSDDAVSRLFAGSDPSLSATSSLSHRIFSRTSGIDAAHIRTLLAKRPSSSTKQWELRKRLEAREGEVVALRTACGGLLRGTEEFATGAAGIERGLRGTLSEARGAYVRLEGERAELAARLEREGRERGEEAAARDERERGLERERDECRTRCEVTSSELGRAKEEVERLQSGRTEGAVALALAESKLAESDVQREELVAKLASMESRKGEAIDKAKAALDAAKGEVERLQKDNREGAVALALAESKLQEVDSQREELLLELENMKGEAERLRRDNKEGAVALALAESRLQESNSQREELLVKLASVESSRVREVEEVESRVAGEAAEKLSALEAENEKLKVETGVRKGREMAVCRFLDVNVCVAEFLAKEHDGVATDVSGNNETTDNFMDLVERRIEELKCDAKEKEQAQKDVESSGVELERLHADVQAALETVATRERDMSELTKSIGDIQRAGQERERKLGVQHKTAEDRAAAAEGQLAECKEKILSLGHEAQFLEKALEESESECAKHKSVIKNLRKEVDQLKDETKQLHVLFAEAEAEGREGEDRVKRLDAQLTEHARAEKELRDVMERTERSLTERIFLAKEETKSKDAEIGRMSETIAALEAQRQSLQRSLTEQKSTMDALSEEEIGRLRGEVANLESRLATEAEMMRSVGAANQTRVRELEEAVRQGRVERKRMHNIIQELRGNVRVFARIRPILPDDGELDEEGAASPSVMHEGDDVVTITKPNDPGQKHKFSFDRVFPASAGQDAVYDEVSEFVQSALDGYNVTIFSYGQTGSGKTYTMQGTGTGDMRGLIPRSIEQIGAHEAQLRNDGWMFSMKLSFLEIYNEVIKDLLREKSKEEGRHEIKVGDDGRRTVTNLTMKSVDPNDRDAIDAVLALAARRRSTTSTDMNAKSSRSHSVFTLRLTATHKGRNQAVHGTLNLVDLAGSERLNRSNAVGQRAKEATSINRSLSSLADVFAAIGQKRSHVPFRHSRLTWLLQPSLSGDGKTLMVANVSPTGASAPESLCTLRFASGVNQCELGKAKRTVEEVKGKKGPASGKRVNAAVGSDSGIAGSAASRKVKQKI